MAAAAGRTHRFVLSSVTSLQLINLILALLPFRCDFEMVHLYSTESKIVRFQKHLKPMFAVLQSQSSLLFKSHLVQAANYKSFLICMAYKPLSRTKGYFGVISAIHILGDLNYILLKSSDPALQAIINFCISLNLTQLINQPTRMTESSATLMNVILASNKNLVRDTKVISVSISDH